MTRALLLAALAVGTGGLAPWDRAGGGPAQRREDCRLVVLNVDREGTRIEVSPEVVNYFAGGNVRMRCQGLDVFMWSDSVASYQGRVVQFVGHVRYRDSTTEQTSDYGTYFRDDDRWEATGRVLMTNRQDGTTLRGPALTYYRRLGGREAAELFADRRPTVTLPVRDSLGQSQEPYVVVADRVRMRGQDQVWAGGRVTIDRSDFRGRGDSLFLDSGAGSAGALIGQANLRRSAADSFDLAGARVDLALERRELTYVTARDSARLATADQVLVGDAIGLDINHRQVEQTVAWGTTVAPVAVSPDYEVRGDSLAFDTPDQQLREIRSFGHGWLGAKPDSAGGERDWVAGDSVVATFVPWDSGGRVRPALQRLEARRAAQAYYRLRQPGERTPSLTYTHADHIVVIMRVADTVSVDSVWALGVKDGVHLQPGVLRADSTRADSAARRVDTLPPLARGVRRGGGRRTR